MCLIMRRLLSSGDLEPPSSPHTSMRQRALRCQILQLPGMRSESLHALELVYSYIEAGRKASYMQNNAFKSVSKLEAGI